MSPLDRDLAKDTHRESGPLMEREIHRPSSTPTTTLHATIPIMGSIRSITEPERFFGPEFFPERKVLLGSCFIAPLRDKFGPQNLIGILCFFDSNPDRYTSEKGSEFVSHFADILGYTLVDIADRKKAELLREDVERMVKNAFRPGQAIRVTPLAQTDPEWADMLTLVLLGATSTRLVDGRLLTPRGYAGKYALSG